MDLVTSILKAAQRGRSPRTAQGYPVYDPETSRRWTPDKDAEILRRRAAGETYRSIGKDMECSAGAVCGRIQRLQSAKKL